MEFWIGLWTFLLWASAIAFALVALYILAGALRSAIGRGGG